MCFIPKEGITMKLKIMTILLLTGLLLEWQNCYSIEWELIQGHLQQQLLLQDWIDNSCLPDAEPYKWLPTVTPLRMTTFG